MLVSAETVTWKEREAYHVGSLLRYKHREGSVVSLYGGLRLSQSIAEQDRTEVLVRHARTCNETESIIEEFVSWSNLFHYYGDKEGKESLPPHHVSKKRYTDEELAERREVLDTVSVKGY